jgi:hypothetical protein
MGHRRNRKRDRRNGGVPYSEFEPKPEPDIDWRALAVERPSLVQMASDVPRPKTTCGGCREFIEDPEGGRGTCLHPGSGILSPWTDTQACDFFAAQRGRAASR